MLLGTLCKFMIHAVKKQDQSHDLLFHRAVSLCFVWPRNWISHRPLAFQQLRVHPTRGPCSRYSGWRDSPCTTDVRQGLSLNHFPYKRHCRSAEHRAVWCWVLEGTLRNFLFITSQRLLHLLGLRNKRGTAICVPWCFIDDFTAANRTKLLIFTFQ